MRPRKKTMASSHYYLPALESMDCVTRPTVARHSTSSQNTTHNSKNTVTMAADAPPYLMNISVGRAPKLPKFDMSIASCPGYHRPSFELFHHSPCGPACYILIAARINTATCYPYATIISKNNINDTTKCTATCYYYATIISKNNIYDMTKCTAACYYYATIIPKNNSHGGSICYLDICVHQYCYLLLLRYNHPVV